ncbi:Carbamoyltransferase [Methanocaldococcus infernus ME]|uniref:Carbamoyltransferase n=1 Tax=Methanocaldococcus infernus (strain DSM 11812 / JCM 15783 / ME) TaxID=573063 RepID=D5VST2_METIM|nr:carbamoyltransferase C-terminal domain-containing protein [Methanocaldococcus infernus]ADG13635.1 Carbamoyltransferase [Methanocaldococcus infernus ME]
MILGIHDGHNSSSSLISRERILWAMSEERFVRKKNYRGFPKNSLSYILSKERDFEYITVGSVFRRGKRLRDIKEFQSKVMKKLLYIYHHLSHSYLYKLSNFKECLVISIDGAGDGLSFLASIGSKDLEIIAESDVIDSVGDFYASITELLGFKAMKDEGKVMSLSSFPCSERIELKVLDYIEELKSFKNLLGVVGREGTEKLRELLNYKGESFNEKVKISRFAQETLERAVLKAVDNLSKEYGIENIVFTGGVAQNVKLNTKIAENYNLFVPPFMGDEGLSLGSSLSDRKIGRIEIKNTYFGYEIENEKVEEIIEEKKLSYKYLEDSEIPEVVGELILKNNIICVARGKMEFGPRALGNRSILALPTRENRERVNKILGRDWFMPFAPTILYEHIDEYLKEPKYSPFMTLLFKVKEEKIKEIEGVVHVDKTTRAQTLKRESNPIYYDTIKYIYDSINLPVLLNTSFNLHGEPIVCTERDAINSFLRTKFNYLLLANYLIKRENL